MILTHLLLGGDDPVQSLAGARSPSGAALGQVAGVIDVLVPLALRAAGPVVCKSQIY